MTNDTQEITAPQELNLKLVATTLIWTNVGNEKMPLWRCSGGKEYIIGRFDYEPALAEIGKTVDDRRHMIENHYPQMHETLSGWQLYHNDAMTHNEYMQYHLTQSVDFEATDITGIDATEEMTAIVAQ
jgi:hypothetical protein